MTRAPRRIGTIVAVGGAAMLAGCNDWQSALDAKGTGAGAIASLILGFTAVLAVIWVLVMLALALAVLRRRSEAERRAAPLASEPRRERTSTVLVSAAVAVTAVILVVLTGMSFLTGRTLASLRGTETLTLAITGNQWWWQVRYEDPQPNLTFTTANEIHIPVGEAVKLKLESSDVIHSFWVPSLTGKEDLIPGHQNELYLKAEKPGVYRGQCAEFCGYQHAHMAILVIAEPKAEFQAWRDHQLGSAAPPAGPEAQAGQHVFLSRGCVMCHAVRGTPAGGTVAPDLTHVAGRRTIAAGALPMTRGSLAAWIADPQEIKPGSNMPRVDLDADELNAVVSYVAGLQ